MKMKRMLPWAEYWPLVLKLHRQNGLTCSIPERDMKQFYEDRLSPLDAADKVYKLKSANGAPK